MSNELELVIDNTNAPIDPESKLAYALRYAKIGMHILPTHWIIDGHCSCGSEKCSTPGKHPYAPAVPFGATQATDDIETIKKWWQRWPECNMATIPAKNNLVVIDIDPRNGGHYTIDELEAKHGPIQSDMLQFSGGGGEHRFFTITPGMKLPGKLGKGVDVISNNYVLLHPSNHISGGVYEWEASSNPLEGGCPSPLPDWLRDLTREIQAPDNSQPASAQSLDESEIFEIKDALTFICADDREIWLSVGMALHNDVGGSLGFDIWSEWSQTSAKYVQHDQLRVWRSFSRKGLSGVTKATIFKLAYDAGWGGVVFPSDKPVELVRKIEPKKQSKLYTPAEPTVLPVAALRDVADYFSGLTDKPTPAISTAGAIALGSVVAGRMYVSEDDNYTSTLMAVSGASGIGKNYIKVGVERLLLRAGYENLIAGNFYTHQTAVYCELKAKPAHICISDEFGENFMEARKNNNSNKLTVFKALKQAFSDAHHIFKADSFSKIGKSAKDIDTTPIRCPSLTLIGLTTPLQFYSEIKVSHIESGLINRFVIVNVDTSDRLTHAKKSAEPDQKLIDLIKSIRCWDNPLMEKGFDEEPETIVVAFSKEARDIFAQAQIWQEEYAATLINDHLDAMPQRWREISMRIATMFAVFDNHRSPVVSREMAQWAVDYVFHHGHKTIQVLRSSASETEYEGSMNLIESFIRANPGCSDTEIARKFRGIKSRERIEVMNHLVSAGAIYSEKECTTGRAKVVWHPV